jgi:3-oxoisoapionate decarboxylase
MFSVRTSTHAKKSYHARDSNDSSSAAVSRRDVLAAAAGVLSAVATRSPAQASQAPPSASAPGDPVNPRLGLDNFAVRAMGWKAKALVGYAASLAVDSLFVTDLDAFESFEASHLRSLAEYARARQLAVQVGTWSICPTSKAFKPNWGTASEHLALAIRVARHVGSPVVRVVLGTWEDRLADGGIDRHIEETVKVCNANRSRAIDANVKIAVENHAGDMHSTELVRLIEAAGTDYVGANLDMGNALWTLEHPLDSLETLGRYALTTSMRDSAVWTSENGARVAWTAMGEGHIDLKAYFSRFRELCPGVPVHIETISGFNREFAYLQPEFWKAWPHMPARSLARFEALARQGKPVAPWEPPPGQDRRAAEQAYQKGELERSLVYCRNELGLGRRRKGA